MFAAIKSNDINKVLELTTTQKSLNKAFEISVEKRKPDLIKILVERGADINYVELKYLWLAIYTDFEAVKFFIEKGLNPNEIFIESGGTPIHLASGDNNNDPKIVEYLIDHGADPNLRCREGWGAYETPLITAVCFNKIDITKVLLDRGANINYQDIYRKRTALMHAAAYDNYEIVKLLLEYGADPTIKDKNGIIAYDLAKSDKIKRLLNPNKIFTKENIDTCRDRKDIFSLENIKNLDSVFLFKFNSDTNICFSENEFDQIKEILMKHYNKKLRSELGRLGGLEIQEIDKVLELFDKIVDS